MIGSAVERAVRTRLGIDPAAVGDSTVARAVAARMRATGATTPEGYLVRLQLADELTALGEELLVPETWFFRGGRRLFDQLGDFLSRRASSNPARPARALCVPCSTGEEPYSLAIACHDRGLTAERVRIDGVDMSPAHLARAATAVYTASAVREPGCDPRSAHFRATGGRWELLPHLRQAVHFQRANFTDPAALAGVPPYDLILCRNLFIYLTPDGRKRATAHLDRLLAVDGWLCLSPAEADRLPRGRFTPVGLPEWCIFRRADAAAPPSPKAPEPPAGVAHPPPVPHPPCPQEPPALPEATRDSPATLQTARTLADSGRLADARRVCERVIAADPVSADGHALLGVILMAEGKAAEAADLFRKTLYLAPDHPDALAHMLVLAERRQDAAQVIALRRRLARRTAGETTT